MKLNSKEQNIWFTSDTHYWHKNITYGVSDWADKDKTTRRFNTTEEMSEHIVIQINKYVKEDDILFHLGDWSFGGIKNIWNFRKQLKCKNIHLILGNHDHHIKTNKFLPNCTWQMNNSEKTNIVDSIEGYGILAVKSKELFSSVNQYSEIQIDHLNVCLMHYPIQEWNDRFKKSIHLFGHVHGRIDFVENFNRLDVGMDNIYKMFKEYRPIKFNEIKKLIKL